MSARRTNHQHCPVPGWVLILSIGAFIAIWTVAPRHIFSLQSSSNSSALSAWSSNTQPIFTGKQLSKLNVAGAATVPQHPVKKENNVASPYIFSQPGKVAFTFDDGPHHFYTKKLLKILQDYKVQATFFVNGCWLDPSYEHSQANRQILLQAFQQGHTIGNHTLNHVTLKQLNNEEQRREIIDNENVIAQVIGERPTLFRSPFAAMTGNSFRILKERDYRIVRWNASADDEKYKQPSEIRDSIMLWLRHHQGGIVMLHDRFYWTVEGVKLILESLQSENCLRLARRQMPLSIVPLEYFTLPIENSPVLQEQEKRELAEELLRLKAKCSPAG